MSMRTQERLGEWRHLHLEQRTIQNLYTIYKKQQNHNTAPALQGGFLTIGPPGKPQSRYSYLILFIALSSVPKTFLKHS